MARVYFVFRGTHETLKAETELFGGGVTCKVVPKPSSITLDCGLAVRIEESDQEKALLVLRQHKLEPRGVFPG